MLNSVVTWIDAPETATDGPLSGMRVGVKDNIDVAGVASTCGSRFFADRIARTDADVVRLLRAAGAIVTSKLNMAEFAVGVTSQNSAAGGVRNPWDLERVPAGSSGGSGAAVAAGLVDASLGTDTGGSVRLPASACGVAGLRPTWGAISNGGVFPVSARFDTVGPMARRVADVARVFDVLTTRRVTSGAAARRVGVPRTFITDDIDPAIAAAVETVAGAMARLGYEIVPIDIPGVEDAQDVVYTLLYSEVAQLHRDRLARSPSLFQKATFERVSLGLDISESQRAAAESSLLRYRRTLARTFGEVDVVLTPTMPIDVPPVEESDDVVAQSRRMGQFSYPWSLHEGPTLAIPVGFHPESGMPIGAQLTAAADREAQLFELGQRYQQITNWHNVIPPIMMG
ncbi:amidase [Nocardia callitridis]|uniref:Amidase n=1 Tax=Nocardia callitridis TaxID=648753 RepID=A0ABP9KWV7_9NOCA